MVAATTLVLLLAAPAVAAMPAHSFSSSYAAQLATLKAQHPELREFNASAAKPRREFPCAPLNRSAERRAASVHELMPQDIAAVGALGDSITAGFGARASSLIDLVIESRGASWSIGGDDDVSTIPNFFRVYNDQLGGFSLGNGNANRGFGDASISGAVAPGMLGQAQTLVSNMQSSMGPESYSEDCESTAIPGTVWFPERSETVLLVFSGKLVTVWIGGNDICSRGTSAQEYRDEIELALDYLQVNMPKVFVNLVTMVDVGSLYDITGPDIGCLIVRPTVCSRGADRESSAQEAAEYQRGITALAALPKYDAEEFTVVDQPWCKYTRNPTTT